MCGIVGAVAERVVDLDDLLRQHQHHAEHVRGDGVGVAAGLVDDQHTGVGAILDVHGVDDDPVEQTFTEAGY